MVGERVTSQDVPIAPFFFDRTDGSQPSKGEVYLVTGHFFARCRVGHGHQLIDGEDIILGDVTSQMPADRCYGLARRPVLVRLFPFLRPTDLHKSVTIALESRVLAR